jgi:hypothetical protein
MELSNERWCRLLDVDAQMNRWRSGLMISSWAWIWVCEVPWIGGVVGVGDGLRTKEPAVRSRAHGGLREMPTVGHGVSAA